MAWLNEANLATWICRLPVPVFTGIGHEIDECILDLVAHRRFDTSSKVAGFIKTSLMSDASTGRAQIEVAYGLILKLVSEQSPRIERASSTFNRLSAELLHGEYRKLLQHQASFEIKVAIDRLPASVWRFSSRRIDFQGLLLVCAQPRG